MVPLHMVWNRGSQPFPCHKENTMFKWKVFFLSLSKKMWPKVSAFALFGIASAFLAVMLRERIPDDIAYTVSSHTVETILNILASSMLAVTTFSLTVMVSAYSSATTSVTPRATQLVIQDHTAQNVLATFLGTFVFSLVGIIALNAEVYHDKGRVVLFITTLLVTAVMVIALIRWIDKLTTIGRVKETTKLVQAAAAKALKARAEAPCLGCNRLQEDIVSQNRVGIIAGCYGYVQFIDTDDLSKVADELDCDMHVVSMPGAFVTPRTPLLTVGRSVDDDTAKKIRAEFTIDDERAFEQDPRFGICVLAEIAQRALPPTINDSGTVMDVLGRLVAVLSEYAEPETETVKCKRIWVPPLMVGDLFNDAFDAISRDSANLMQIQVRLQKCLWHLHELEDPDFKKYAIQYSRLAIMRSDASCLLDFEKEELRKLALP